MSQSTENPDFEALLDYIKQTRGFDFTGYKRSSLMRRVTKRMQTVEIDQYSEYIDYLEVHPEEFGYLFNTLLINVTAFFRDRSAWEYVADEVIPAILAHKSLNEPIRIWSAGCASGEEAYTIAILLAEAIGIHQFRDRVKIYATDVDEEALNQARLATYTEKQLDGILPHQLEQFFDPADNSYTFRKDLRRAVIFGRHDLVQDAPISRIDLLICRNTLMYFNAETQSRILARFHFALQESGFLFLGKAEMLLTHTDTFTSVDLRRRVFTKVPSLNLRDRLFIPAQTSINDPATYINHHARLHEATFDSCPLARIVVDGNGLLVLANERARLLFNLTLWDINRPLSDLEVSYRPIELRSCIEQTCTQRREIYVRDVEWQPPQGEPIYLDVEVLPLFDPSNQILGVSINFIEITRYKHLQAQLEQSHHELEMAYEELQSTNEELETTNEELQSSNEELETTNEELQSTNEELETMNEELQSTNEELQTVNHELQCRSEELNQTNAFLEAIFISLKGGVVAINRDLMVQIWNNKLEDLWGLRANEAIGQHFLNLDIGLPIEQLRQPIRLCLGGDRNSLFEVVLEAVNRRGKNIQCRVACTPLMNIQGESQGVILLMEEQGEIPAT